MFSEQRLAIAFFIDADNLTGDEVAQAFEHFKSLNSPITVRRAYGGLEKLTGMKDVLRRYTVSAYVNQGKGTTDVALTVDAMDLFHRGGLPTTVVICSSDFDFVPLAVRFREAGLRTICFAQKDRAVSDLARGYDEVVYALTTQVIDKTTNDVPPITAPDKKMTEAILQAWPVSSGDDIVAVRQILAVFPDWLPHTIKQLNQMGTQLREGGVKKGSRPLHEVFGKYPSYFKVLPITGECQDFCV